MDLVLLWGTDKLVSPFFPISRCKFVYAVFQPCYKIPLVGIFHPVLKMGGSVILGMAGY